MNLTLLHLTRDKLEWARQLHNDPDVLSMLTDPRVITPNEQSRWFNNLSNSKSMVRLVIFNDQFVPMGLVRLDQIDMDNKSICIGLDIHKNFRGQGLAKPVYRLLFDEWFNEHKMNRIWLMVADYNTVAKNLYQQLGFIEEGRQREALYKNKKFHDYITMSILRSEYDPSL